MFFWLDFIECYKRLFIFFFKLGGNVCNSIVVWNVSCVYIMKVR